MGQNKGKTYCTNCTSSNAVEVYEKEDGTLDGYCWSCHKPEFNLSKEQLREVGIYDYNKQYSKNYREKEVTKQYGAGYEERPPIMLPQFHEVQQIEPMPQQWRGIEPEVLKLYGMKFWSGPQDLSNTRQYPHKATFYPVFRDDNLIGYKPRTYFKPDHPNVLKGKVKPWTFKCFEGYVGQKTTDCQLFGQNLHKIAPRTVVIAGGQEDACSIYQAIAQNSNSVDLGKPFSRIAVVSPQNGENDRDIKKNFKWFSSCEEVVLCFDNDEAGKKATQAVTQLFSSKRVRLMNLGEYNDPNEMLEDGQEEALCRAFWDAKEWTPEDIKSLSECFEDLVDRGDWVLIPFPNTFETLNKKTLGGRGLGEITTLLAPSSVGKSTVVNEWIYAALEKTDIKVGVISLEADGAEFIEQLASIINNKRYVEIKKTPEILEEMQAGVQPYLDRVKLVDSASALKNEKHFWDMIDYLVKVQGCQTIVFDPATLGVRAAKMDEDDFLAKLVPYVKSNRLDWINVVHSRKNSVDQQANSEGKELAEEDIRGTSSWFQVSSNNIILNRNKKEENYVKRNTLRLDVTKIRRNGTVTGFAGTVFYEAKTGRLVKSKLLENDENTDQTTLRNQDNPISANKVPYEETQEMLEYDQSSGHENIFDLFNKAADTAQHTYDNTIDSKVDSNEWFDTEPPWETQEEARGPPDKGTDVQADDWF